MSRFRLARFLIRKLIPSNNPSSMNDNYLARKLFWIVLLKLAVLFALWWVFFRGQTVTVDPAADIGTAQQTEKGEAPHGQ